jgi:hypothetical protein
MVAIGVLIGLPVLADTANAGPVFGRLELPASATRTPPPIRGFVTPQPNLLAPPRPVDPTPYLAVVLEGENPVATAKQITLELVGERFANPVIAVGFGSELIIKNGSKTPRLLSVVEAPKLLDSKVLNPSGTTTLKPTKVGDVYTIRDNENPHVTCTVIVTQSAVTSSVAADGKFDFGTVSDGKYTLKVFYRSGWVEGVEAGAISVAGAGKVEVKAKVPAGFPLKK